MKTEKPTKQRPRQRQIAPGYQEKMKPLPQVENEGSGHQKKLEGMVALITGGDSGIGRSVAVRFAEEGADVAIVYLKEHRDAEETKAFVEEKGQKCLLIPGDIGKEKFCKNVVKKNRC